MDRAGSETWGISLRQFHKHRFRRRRDQFRRTVEIVRNDTDYSFVPTKVDVVVTDGSMRKFLSDIIERPVLRLLKIDK